MLRNSSFSDFVLVAIAASPHLGLGRVAQASAVHWLRLDQIQLRREIARVIR
jgi:hypothetical protein